MNHLRLLVRQKSKSGAYRLELRDRRGQEGLRDPSRGGQAIRVGQTALGGVGQGLEG
jgi:hypothetical protein